MRFHAVWAGSVVCVGLPLAPPASGVPPAECGVNLATPQIAVTSVRYQWQGDHVAMLDPEPR